MTTIPWAKKWWIFAWSDEAHKASPLLEKNVVYDEQGIWCAIYGRLYFLVTRNVP